MKAPQNAGPEEINTADIRDVHVTLPEGMTLNPSAAHGLQPARRQAGLRWHRQFVHGPVTCPAASKVGTVAIETVLPPGALAGNVYLGNPNGGSITASLHDLSRRREHVGVSVRLQGTVTPDPSTGRLRATFVDNPQLTFSEIVLKLDGGPRAPVANPLVCGTASIETLFTPYTGLAPALSATPFTTTGCPSPLPFSLTQSTQTQTPTRAPIPPIRST